MWYHKYIKPHKGGRNMKIGFRMPNLQKSISAKLSVERNLVQNLGFGKGLIPDKKKQRYNRRYRRNIKDIKEISKNLNAISALRSERVAKIQMQLKSKGFYTGIINGRLDIFTVSAIKNFQQKNGMFPSGELDVQTVSKINK